ncbi:hypothetical protein KM043_014354 [Ampulex compressa]|nr:hypothetical protein KM043_014354 [Ampulex compressa]
MIGPSRECHAVKSSAADVVPTTRDKKSNQMSRMCMHMMQTQRTHQRYSFNNSTQGCVIATLEVLGSGAPGAASGVCLTTEDRKYLFNCGEGSQRIAHEHKLKLSKLNHLFITSASWKCMGGLPGTLLTMQGIGVSKVCVHAPQGVTDIVPMISEFARLPQIAVSSADCKEDKPYSDRILSVQYVIVRRSEGSECTWDSKEDMEEGIGTSKEENEKVMNTLGKRVHVDDNKSEDKGKKARKTKSLEGKITDVLCYICKLCSRPGKLNLRECLEKGLTPGPLLGRLKRGEDVQLSNGSIVHSKDVCSPTIPGPVFIVVECPSEEYLESFTKHTAFHQHQNTESMEQTPYCIVHFTPQHVMECSSYKEWMDKFSSSTHHLVFNENNICMGNEAAHRYQYGLHMVHPDIFPLLDQTSFAQTKNVESILKIHRAKTLQKVHLLPEKSFDETNVISLSPKKYIDEYLGIKDFSECLIILAEEQNPEYQWHIAQHILRTIKAIYVSHMHADHHVGLIGLVHERQKYTDENLFLLLPEKLVVYLEYYHKRFEPILDYCTIIQNQDLFFRGHRLPNFIQKQLYAALNITSIDTVFVRHCLHAYGISVMCRDNSKIVYSGDTMPCSSLVEMGHNCDLLIHEATMEDGLEKEARLKAHCTCSQAINVGKNMRAKFILLTHFSQRYAKIPYLTDDIYKELSNVGFAYDNMQFSLWQLPLLPLLYPTLKVLFGEEYSTVHSRAQKRLNACNRIN